MGGERSLPRDLRRPNARLQRKPDRPKLDNPLGVVEILPSPDGRKRLGAIAELFGLLKVFHVRTFWSLKINRTLRYHIEKDKLRAEIWSLLKKEKATVRDPFGHIPNFINAKEAAEVLATLPIWQAAKTIKCNPDSPHIPVRSRALEDGKRLYMAVPRLSGDRAFVELMPHDLRDRHIPFEEAAIAKKALTYGRWVSFEEMEAIDLVVVGCVAVGRNGGRTGKGAGFADLELAMLKTFGLIKDDTPIVTTVHPLQIVDDSRLPMQPHDWALNWIVTAQGAIATNTTYPRPSGLDWEAIRPEQYHKIPILRKLKEQKS